LRAEWALRGTATNMSTPKTPATPAETTGDKVTTVVTTVVQVAGILVPEAGPALQLFGLLEPEIQKGFSALIHKAHAKQLTAQDYLDQAQALVNSRGV
jgi:hypothetical protein